MKDKIEYIKSKATAGNVAGAALVGTGLSMVPATVRMGKATKAMSSMSKALKGKNMEKAYEASGDLVQNYVEGAKSFGKTPLGKLTGNMADSQLKNIEGKGTFLSKKLKPLLDKAIGKDSLSAIHYKSFVKDKSPNDTYKFWAHVEALGRPKGRFEVASTKVISDLKAARGNKKSYGINPAEDRLQAILFDKKISDTQKVETLIKGKHIDMSKKYEVPKWDSPSAIEAQKLKNGGKYNPNLNLGLRSIYSKHTNTKNMLNNFEGGLDSGKSIKELSRTGTKEQKEVIRRMALDKAQGRFPATYTMALSGATVGLTGAGAGVLYKENKKNNEAK